MRRRPGWACAGTRRLQAEAGVAASERSRIASPRSSSSSVADRGGSRRMTFPSRPHEEQRGRARARARRRASPLPALRSASSSASIAPRPRTSPTTGACSRPSSRCAAASRSDRRARGTRRGELVEHGAGGGAEPGSRRRPAEAARVGGVHDRGLARHRGERSPPPSVLPATRMSGSTSGARSPTASRFCRSRTAPRRRRRGCRGARSRSLSARTNSAGIGMKPPSPWTGSSTMHATSPGRRPA